MLASIIQKIVDFVKQEIRLLIEQDQIGSLY